MLWQQPCRLRLESCDTVESLGLRKLARSTEVLERAIVAAMLDGRGAVAEMLAERLRGRRHAQAGNVVALATKQAERK